MKYKLRFFIKTKPGQKHAEHEECFADVVSEKIPQKGEYVYLCENILDFKSEKLLERLNIPAYTIYKVLYSVIIYDNVDGKKDDCSSIEIVVRKTSL